MFGRNPEFTPHTRDAEQVPYFGRATLERFHGDARRSGRPGVMRGRLDENVEDVKFSADRSRRQTGLGQYPREGLDEIGGQVAMDALEARGVFGLELELIGGFRHLVSF
jgi:hypothetical protein